jgi:D-mannonate dehydratase
VWIPNLRHSYQPRLYQRLIDIDPSPSSKLEFCLGTLGEMTGDDFYEAVDSYSRHPLQQFWVVGIVSQ